MELVFDLTHHKELWNWLADHPKREKYDWFKMKLLNGEKFSGMCFACIYADEVCEKACLKMRIGYCDTCDIYCSDSCPLEFQVECDNADSLYYQWVNASNLEERTRIARLIANTPVKEGVKTK
jgi:hypothetical protein